MDVHPANMHFFCTACGTHAYVCPQLPDHLRSSCPCQVLMISANPDAWEFQPENTLKLKPWTHENPKDTTLLDLIPMLQLIATRGVKDVRDVVRGWP